MIPSLELWHKLETAPRDGSPFMVIYREFGRKDGKLKVQAAQYLCNEDGAEWRWRNPFHVGQTVYAEGWLRLEELITYQDAAPEEFERPAPKPAEPEEDEFANFQAPEQDFDL